MCDLKCAPQLLSAAEDSFVRVWHLTVTPESNTVEVELAKKKKKTEHTAHFVVEVHFLSINASISFISSQVAHLHNECVTDTQICGAKFCDGDGYAFAVTGYDLNEIMRYTQT